MPPLLPPIEVAVDFVASSRLKVRPVPPVPPFSWAVKLALRPELGTAVP